MNNTRRETIVLIGTWNGERYLAEQIESILNQEIGDLHILLRDDQSDDATPRLLADLELRHANIEVIKDDLGRLGYAQNFSLLMREACRRKPKYVLFSDQDDIWHPRRLARQVETLLHMERQTSPATPCLTHCDLQLIDEQGRRIAESLLRAQGIRIPGTDQSLAQLIAANFVTGCTIAINRALLELATPVPSVIRHHDHWLALCAAACGRIESNPDPLVQYRQHDANIIGGFTLGRFLRMSPSNLIQKIQHHREDMQLMPELLQALQRRCSARASVQASRLLSHTELVARGELSRIARYRALQRLGIKPSGLPQSLLWFVKNLLA